MFFFLLFLFGFDVCSFFESVSFSTLYIARRKEKRGETILHLIVQTNKIYINQNTQHFAPFPPPLPRIYICVCAHTTTILFCTIFFFANCPEILEKTEKNQIQ
jgi:hypothetical protein